MEIEMGTNKASELRKMRMEGNRNPMRRPEVAAKVAESTRQRWADGLQAGSLEGLKAGRVWTDERRAAWKEKAKTSWTPEMREAARQRALARHAAARNDGTI
jgi:RPA family protein